MQENLTEIEYEVLKYVVRGLSNSEVAKRMFITEHTVKAHMTDIMLKLNVKSRTGATFVALTQHLIKEEDLYWE